MDTWTFKIVGTLLTKDAYLLTDMFPKNRKDLLWRAFKAKYGIYFSISQTLISPRDVDSLGFPVEGVSSDIISKTW